MPTRRALLAATAALVMSLTTACSGSQPDNSSDGARQIEVWTADTLPDRVAATKEILKDFTAKTGIKVKLTGVAEDQFNQVLTASAAAGKLPDVWGSLSLEQVRTLSVNGITDTDANAAVVQENGENTFSPRALALTRDGDQQIAVPSDSWAQLLIYRKDLFQKAGLPAPKTFADVLAAAKKLNSPPQMAGFVGATTPNDSFTRQTFEHIALANGCNLVNSKGDVTFDSKPCVDALKFYGDLIGNYSVAGNQDVDTTRATYFAGKSAMLIWSTFILDEMAGLRDDAMPSCPQCASDPAFLAKNSGVVAALQGPDAQRPAQYGQVTSWSILKDADTEAAKEFVNYMLNEGYEDWTRIAPEGKVPVRKGTPSDPTKFIDAWKAMPVGVDRKAPLSKFYGKDVLNILAEGPDNFDRWGIEQGQGKLLGAMTGEMPVAAAVGDVTNGGTDPATAAEKTADAIRSLQDSVK